MLDWQAIRHVLEAYNGLSADERAAVRHVIEAFELLCPAEPVKRPRGRPKGSKTKKGRAVHDAQ